MPRERILVTGASGRLGASLLRRAARMSQPVLAWCGPGGGTSSMRPVDLTESGQLERALVADDPGVVIHAAAVSSADLAYRHPDQAWRLNVEATRQLAEWCQSRDRRLIFTSTDLVFDGSRGFWSETDAPHPILEYGRSKRAAELLLEGLSCSLVVRIALLYGFAPADRPGFFDKALATLRAGTPCAFFSDEFRSPLHYDCAAKILLELARTGSAGVLHAGGPERLSRYQLMLQAARMLGLDPALVHANRQADVVLPEPRPRDVSLDSSRLLALLPDQVPAPVSVALKSEIEAGRADSGALP